MSVNTKIGLEATYLFEEETDVLLKVIFHIGCYH